MTKPCPDAGLLNMTFDEWRAHSIAMERLSREIHEGLEVLHKEILAEAACRSPKTQ